MRVLTWNLDHGCRGSKFVLDGQAALIAGADADVCILTEVPVEWSSAGSDRVVSPAERQARRGLESWVAVVGRNVVSAPIAIPFERMAVAALIEGGESLVVYGSVLPWNAAITQAPYLALPCESAAEVFERVLVEQVADIESLRRQYPDRSVIWAGDFNQPVEGPNSGFSKRNRELLMRALASLDLVAYNSGLAHAKDGWCAIDLICGPVSKDPSAVGRIDAKAGGAQLSDHAAYVVDV